MLDSTDGPGWILGGGLLALAALVGGAASAERKATIDQIDERGRKYPSQTKILIDMARAGTCGLSAEDRQAFARNVQRVGEDVGDRAVADPLLDLHYHLKRAYDDRESQELCAAGLGSAWRAEHPFRKPKSGDPYDVLYPHADDTSAVMALDRARRLPPPPSATMFERADVQHLYETFSMGTVPSVPYSRSLAMGLLGSARSELQSARALTPESRLAAQYAFDRAIKIVDHALAWTQSPALNYDSDLEIVHAIHAAPQVRKVRAKAEKLWQDRYKRAFELAQRATEYVKGYNNLVPLLRSAERSVEEGLKAVGREPHNSNFQEFLEGKRAELTKYQRLLSHQTASEST